MAITSNKALLPQGQAQGICQDIVFSQCEEWLHSFCAHAEGLLDMDLSLICLKKYMHSNSLHQITYGIP